MKNVMKTATLESKFPLLAVENGCIISKDADITVAYRVELPELFTLTRAEYESMHSTWVKAVKVLPNYSIVHKQDFFIEEGYKPDICKEDLSFLSRSFERHFNERPYLQHTCYLFLTKTTKEHSRTTSSFNSLTRGFIIPKEMQDKETVTRFMECCGQFERIVNDSGLLRIIRLTDEEIIGSKNSAGIIEKYFSMSQEDATCLQDLSLGAGEMKLDYPQIINKFNLYIKSGMTIRKAWFKIAGEYEKDQKEKEQISDKACGRKKAYEEMVNVMYKISGGASEGECYEEYGIRCNLSEYRKFGMMLSQNLRKGTRGLTELLEREAEDAFEQRKNLAKKAGEEAGTKLMIPLFLMLIIVFAIVIVPAFFSIRI